MVSTGKHEQPAKAKPAIPTTAAKPAAVPTPNTTSRPSLPALMPAHDAKPPAADAQHTTAAVGTNASEKASQPANETATGNAKSGDSPAAEKTVEKLGPKLRKRDDILKALRAGGMVEKIEGLYRIVGTDGKMNSTSKRRILSLQNQKLLVASSDGKTLTLDTEADKKALEPRTPASTSSTAKPESPTSAKPEDAE